MRNTLGKLCVILAALVLLFSVAFFTVSLILKDNDAYHALQAVSGLIVTGPTGTNVNDVAVALLHI